jgi:hypothetical protein
MPGSGGSHGGSKGVAVTNWLVQKAAGLLEKKTSRRGFLIGSAMAGSAVAVAGCVPATTPGSFYTHITDCAGGLCTDGYTDFCCTINRGINACPPNSFWGGWWRADYSSFCNGTRYYIDCMQNCCGPKTGFQNFCAGCEECRCAGGCDTRRVYCNYFRYGQCHTDITSTGPIACRVVTCVPPYIADPACSTATLVDNSTAEHTSPCITVPPALNTSGAGAVAPDGRVFVFSRAFSGNVQTSNTVDGVNWTPLTEIAPNVNSGIAAAADGTSVYVFGRAADSTLHFNRNVNGTWTGEGSLPGLGVVGDPSVCSDATGVHIFIRSYNNGIYHGVIKDGAWSDWEYVGGQTSSNPVAGASPDGVFVVVRGNDGQPLAARKAAGSWQPFQPLGGQMKGSAGVAGSSDGLHVFVRGTDDALWVRSFSGGSWSSSWARIGGYLIGDPFGVGDPGGNYCITWGVEETPRFVRRSGGGWTAITPLPGEASAIPIGFAGSGGPWVLVRGTDLAHWVGHLNGTSWSGFHSIGGVDANVTALATL